MSIWKALFGKPEPRKSNSSYPGEPPAGYNQPLSARNCTAGKVNGIGHVVEKDFDNSKKFEIDPECGDAYNLDWEEFDQWYNEKISLLKSQGRSFFVVYTFNGHDEGAEVNYRICDSREQMEKVRRSYDDMTDRYIPHELVINVVNGEEVETPPEWWTDYENNFNQAEKLRKWKESGSKQYRL